MIYKTVNRFSKLNSSSLHARLIFDCQNLAIVDHQNSACARVRQHPVARIQLGLESGDIQSPSPDAGGPDSGRN
jgi:hypothetical protein